MSTNAYAWRAVLFVLLSACIAASPAVAQPNHCDGGNVCRVAVDQLPGTEGCGPDGSNVRVVPYRVVMGTGGPRRVVWHLREKDWWFCQNGRDGILPKSGTDTDGQFSNEGATDQPDGGNPGPGIPGRCFKNFRWDNRNDPATHGRDYEYLVRFTIKRGGQDVACATDPFVRNGN